MSNSPNEAVEQASIEALEALIRLFDSDPVTIAAMSSKEIDEGFHIMNVSSRAKLPDRIERIIESKRPRRHTGVLIAVTTFGMLLVWSIVRILGRRPSALAGFCGILIGALVTGLITVRISDNKIIALERGWDAERVAMQGQIKSAAQTLEAKEAYYEKMKSKWRLYSALYTDTLQQLRASKRVRANAMPKEQSPIVISEKQMALQNEASFFNKLGNGPLENPRPRGLPAQGTIESETDHNGDEHPSGVMLSVEAGTDIKATADGIVLTGMAPAKYGKSVVVMHEDGVKTIYGPVTRIRVLPGQEVRLGQVIGNAVEIRGRKIVPLSYRIYKNNEPENIVSYIAGRKP